MTLEAILFDLDDTLLGNDMDVFLPSYFTLLARHAARLTPNSDIDFIQAMLVATRAVIKNVEPALTNEALFWKVLAGGTGVDWEMLNAPQHFDAFYRDGFHQLREVTTPRPVAADFVRWAFDQKLRVVIATNPLFPRSAIESRLAWAGVPVSDFAYDLVTHYGNMHATKPHVAYYEEILDRIACRPAQALMIGDSWTNDIEPASRLGMATYWITAGASPPAADLATGFGSLTKLYARMRDGWLINAA